MKYVARGLRTCLPMVAALVAATALSAHSAASPGESTGRQALCEVCGAAMDEHAVAVLDWETNREHRYHDLACAVREMQARFPWSRAVMNSPLSGQRITLTRISGTWRAQPEQAVGLRLPSEVAGCDGVLAFAGLPEAQEYRAMHRAANAAIVPLESIPAGLPPSRPISSAAATPAEEPAPPAAQTQLSLQADPRSESTGRPPVPAFRDVPPGHWAAEFVEKARALGIMDGYPDGTFRGNEPVTRYEMAAIIAKLADSGAAVATEQTGTARPQQTAARVFASAAPTAAPAVAEQQPLPAPTPAQAWEPEPSLWGLSGPLTAPDARVRGAGSLAAVVGNVNDEFLGAAAAGIGDGVEIAATSTRIGDNDRLFLSAKKLLQGVHPGRADVAVGVTGVGADSSGFVTLTRQAQIGSGLAAVTVGLGTGGVLDGPFAGAELSVSGRLVPFVRSVSLLAESVDDGHERDFNYGLALNVRPELDLKLGSVEEQFAAGLRLGRRF